MSKITDAMLDLMKEFGATATYIESQTAQHFVLQYSIGEEQWVTILSAPHDTDELEVVHFQGESLSKLKQILSISN